DSNEQQSEEQRPSGAGLQLVTDLGANHLNLLDLNARINRLERILNLLPNGFRILRRIGSQSDVDSARTTERIYLRVFETGSREFGAHRVHVDRLGEGGRRADTTGEVDAEIQ